MFFTPRHALISSPLPVMVAQDKSAIFYWMREWAGVYFLNGLIVYIVSFFVGGDEKETA